MASLRLQIVYIKCIGYFMHCRIFQLFIYKHIHGGILLPFNLYKIKCNWCNIYMVWIFNLDEMFLHQSNLDVILILELLCLYEKWYIRFLFMLQINDYISSNKQDKQMLVFTLHSNLTYFLSFQFYMMYYIMTQIWVFIRTEKILNK